MQWFFFVCIDLSFELNIACRHSIESPRLTFILTTYHHHHRVRMPGGSLSPTDCATGTPPRDQHGPYLCVLTACAWSDS
jgi:hypothetical protein